MAASIPIEEDSGTYTGHGRGHNGYYAGDFSQRPPHRLPRVSPAGCDVHPREGYVAKSATA
jgi:hypothetical protein